MIQSPLAAIQTAVTTTTSSNDENLLTANADDEHFNANKLANYRHNHYRHHHQHEHQNQERQRQHQHFCHDNRAFQFYNNSSKNPKNMDALDVIIIDHNQPTIGPGSFKLLPPLSLNSRSMLIDNHQPQQQQQELTHNKNKENRSYYCKHMMKMRHNATQTPALSKLMDIEWQEFIAKKRQSGGQSAEEQQQQQQQQQQQLHLKAYYDDNSHNNTINKNQRRARLRCCCERQQQQYRNNLQHNYHHHQHHRYHCHHKYQNEQLPVAIKSNAKTTSKSSFNFSQQHQHQYQQHEEEIVIEIDTAISNTNTTTTTTTMTNDDIGSTATSNFTYNKIPASSPPYALRRMSLQSNATDDACTDELMHDDEDNQLKTNAHNKIDTDHDHDHDHDNKDDDDDVEIDVVGHKDNNDNEDEIALTSQNSRRRPLTLGVKTEERVRPINIQRKRFDLTSIDNYGSNSCCDCCCCNYCDDIQHANAVNACISSCSSLESQHEQFTVMAECHLCANSRHNNNIDEDADDNDDRESCCSCCSCCNPMDNNSTAATTPTSQMCTARDFSRTNTLESAGNERDELDEQLSDTLTPLSSMGGNNSTPLVDSEQQTLRSSLSQLDDASESAEFYSLSSCTADSMQAQTDTNNTNKKIIKGVEKNANTYL